MVNNVLLRVISALVLGAVSIFCIMSGGLAFVALISVALMFMLYEWASINPNKKNWLYVFGNIYLIIPMAYWLFHWDVSNILWILGIVCSCDIFAFIGGKLLKGPKFAPSISPNKTWSGIIVGSAAAFMFSYIFYYSANFEFFAGTIVIIIASIYGDLLESKVKRILNVKDTGNIIPGHGGVCDRLDSFLLATYALMIMMALFR